MLDDRLTITDFTVRNADEPTTPFDGLRSTDGFAEWIFVELEVQDDGILAHAAIAPRLAPGAEPGADVRTLVDGGREILFPGLDMQTAEAAMQQSGIYIL